MYLKEKDAGHLVHVLDLQGLFDPHDQSVKCERHYGEEAQDAEQFQKAGLVFPSGEALPRCWTDPHYRDKES